MTNLRTALALCALSLAAAACGKSSAGPAGAPCDAKAIEELAKTLDTANGIGVDLQDKSLEKPRAEAKAKVDGKKYAFKGCTFAMQGNDTVTFGATGTDKTLGCVMKGGEDGVKSFRHAAMKLDFDKLKLDVSGVIKLHGEAPFDDYGLTDCTISAHE